MTIMDDEDEDPTTQTQYGTQHTIEGVLKLGI